MTCRASLKEGNISLTSPNKSKQLSGTPYIDGINHKTVVQANKDVPGIAIGENVIQEPNLQATPIYKPTMIVTLQIPRKHICNTENLRCAAFQRKSLAQKELNSVQRRKQIAEYNSLKLKEERQQRYRIRHGGEPSSPYEEYSLSSLTTSSEDNTLPSKRKKRVSFEF